MSEIIITKLAGTEDTEGSTNEVHNINLKDVGYLEAIAIRERDDIQIIFNKSIIRIQVKQ